MRPFASEYAHFGHTSRGAQSKHFAVAGNRKIFFFGLSPRCADNYSTQTKAQLLLRKFYCNKSNFALDAPPFCAANAAAIALLPGTGNTGFQASAIARPGQYAFAACLFAMQMRQANALSPGTGDTGFQASAIARPGQYAFAACLTAGRRAAPCAAPRKRADRYQSAMTPPRDCKIIVTGPSLTSATSIIAPNCPYFTAIPA